MSEKKSIEKLEKEIEKIKKRNKKVEADKSWEISTERKISVAIITYIMVVIIMYFLNFEKIYINALIPTFGYLLSTLWINPMKKIYIGNYLKKEGK